MSILDPKQHIRGAILMRSMIPGTMPQSRYVYWKFPLDFIHYREFEVDAKIVEKIFDTL
jgi:hypothetical protein